MKKFGKDPAVKKTLIRNYEKQVTKENLAVYESIPSCSKKTETKTKGHNHKQCELDHPTVCSSESLANYLNYSTKSALLPPLSAQDMNVDKAEMSAQITKQLNFHFNDRIYKDLVELNADVACSNSKTNKKSTKMKPSQKRDLEPNIEDFYNEEVHYDVYPDIPILPPKIYRVKPIENGDLHRLVAAFENL